PRSGSGPWAIPTPCRWATATCLAWWGGRWPGARSTTPGCSDCWSPTPGTGTGSPGCWNCRPGARHGAGPADPFAITVPFEETAGTVVPGEPEMAGRPVQPVTGVGAEQRAEQ